MVVVISVHTYAAGAVGTGSNHTANCVQAVSQTNQEKMPGEIDSSNQV